jgi:hypothetical protein
VIDPYTHARERSKSQQHHSITQYGKNTDRLTEALACDENSSSCDVCGEQILWLSQSNFENMFSKKTVSSAD